MKIGQKADQQPQCIRRATPKAVPAQKPTVKPIRASQGRERFSEGRRQTRASVSSQIAPKASPSGDLMEKTRKSMKPAKA